MHVGLDKYDTWFVRNVSSSEANWADNTTLTESRGQEADLITLGQSLIHGEVVGSGNTMFKTIHLDKIQIEGLR